MKKFQRIVTILFTLILAVCACFGLASCKEEKVQIALRVECEGKIYEFPPDVEEICVERKYDGKEHYYYVYEGCYVNYPEGKDVWFSMRYAQNTHLISGSIWYQDKDGNTDGTLTKIKNPGVYVIIFRVVSLKEFYETRRISLKVIVKD